MNRPTVIQVESISKQYRLGVLGTGTFTRDVSSWWARVRGEEDPNSKIGEVNDRTVKGKSGLVWALRDINFEVKQGDVLGIVGKNGAGKSTLLKILSRTTSPTTGRIRVKGRIASLLEVGTGFHPELTGRENVFLNGAILGMTRAEIRSKFDEIVDFSGVTRYIDTPVKRYSSGMYVRLAFAVAAHLEPEILVVDEVLAVGDFEFQTKCLGKMKKVSQEGRTVLFVSHNLTAVRNLCNTGLLLKNGEVDYLGGVSEVIDRYIGKSSLQDRPVFKAAEQPGKEAQILEVRLEPGASGYFDIAGEFKVFVRFKVNAPITGLAAGFSIARADSTEPVLASNEAELNPESLKLRIPGVYESTIKVPSMILNSGLYTIRVGLTAQRQIYSVVDDLLFDLKDSAGIFLKLGYERKNAILSTQLPWETKWIEQ
ncbi:MAG: ABC transporter ATP-binding protein [Bacteroidia bacterium]|nr:ABC transporter ATP-binding protein [Bacteroidia bacterium]